MQGRIGRQTLETHNELSTGSETAMSKPSDCRVWAVMMESWGKEEAVVVGMGPGWKGASLQGLYSKGISTADGHYSARKTQVGIWVSTVIPAASGYTVDASLTVLVLASSPSRVPKNLASLYLRPLRKYNKGT